MRSVLWALALAAAAAFIFPASAGGKGSLPANRPPSQSDGDGNADEAFDFNVLNHELFPDDPEAFVQFAGSDRIEGGTIKHWTRDREGGEKAQPEDGKEPPKRKRRKRRKRKKRADAEKGEPAWKSKLANRRQEMMESVDFPGLEPGPAADELDLKVDIQTLVENGMKADESGEMEQAVEYFKAAARLSAVGGPQATGNPEPNLFNNVGVATLRLAGDTLKNQRTGENSFADALKLFKSARDIFRTVVDTAGGGEEMAALATENLRDALEAIHANFKEAPTDEDLELLDSNNKPYSETSYMKELRGESTGDDDGQGGGGGGGRGGGGGGPSEDQSPLPSDWDAKPKRRKRRKRRNDAPAEFENARRPGSRGGRPPPREAEIERETTHWPTRDATKRSEEDIMREFNDDEPELMRRSKQALDIHGQQALFKDSAVYADELAELERAPRFMRTGRGPLSGARQPMPEPEPEPAAGVEDMTLDELEQAMERRRDLDLRPSFDAIQEAELRLLEAGVEDPDVPAGLVVHLKDAAEYRRLYLSKSGALQRRMMEIVKARYAGEQLPAWVYEEEIEEGDWPSYAGLPVEHLRNKMDPTSRRKRQLAPTAVSELLDFVLWRARKQETEAGWWPQDQDEEGTAAALAAEWAALDDRERLPAVRARTKTNPPPAIPSHSSPLSKAFRKYVMALTKGARLMMEQRRYVEAAHLLCSHESAMRVRPTPAEVRRGRMSSVKISKARTVFGACGVVIIERAIPFDVVFDMRNTQAKMFHKHMNSVPKSWHTEKTGFETTWIAKRAPGRYEFFNPLELPWTDPRVVNNGLAFPVIAPSLENRLELDTFSVVTSLPGAPTQPWHADAGQLFTRATEATGQEPGSRADARSRLVHLEPHGIVQFVALKDNPRDMGPTEFVAGSHFYCPQSIQQEQLVPKRILIRMCPSAVGHRVVYGSGAPGSIILFDFRVYHRGGPNMSQNETRPLAYSTYMREWYRDAVNFQYSQTKEFDDMSSWQRKVFNRLDTRRYINRIEEKLQNATGVDARELQSDYDFHRYSMSKQDDGVGQWRAEFGV